ncbi:MAG: MBL fold metallo-hydrolase [Clostridia bacterium]|nr:MBL fold metallo-hydrolase [Clostridia bacterium]
MNRFEKVIGNIYRLKVPFENIYTSVFFIDSKEKKVLIDCATYPSDVDLYIIPALRDMGYSLSGTDVIVISHPHGDHAGGLKRILELCPSIAVVTDIRDLSSEISTYPLPGHTKDLIGVFDKVSSTLISCDGLQGAGVDKYRCYTECPQEYLKTLDRLKNDKKVENILFSHAYEPWNCENVFGRDNVLSCLDECGKYVKI